jgi:hypothetical protein
MCLSDGGSDSGGDAGCICGDGLSLGLDDDGQLFDAVVRNGHRGDAARPQDRIGGFDGAFDVVGMMLEATDDDEVLEPSGDVKFAFVEATGIAGAQPGLAW